MFSCCGGHFWQGSSCLEQHTTPSPSSFNYFFFNSNDFLIEEWDERGKKGEGEEQNSRKQALNRRMPTPCSCRVPARFRCSGPISSLLSIYLRVCRIWLRRCTFRDDPFWRKYNVSGKKRRGFLLRYRFIIEH